MAAKRSLHVKAETEWFSRWMLCWSKMFFAYSDMTWVAVGGVESELEDDDEDDPVVVSDVVSDVVIWEEEEDVLVEDADDEGEDEDEEDEEEDSDDDDVVDEVDDAGESMFVDVR